MRCTQIMGLTEEAHQYLNENVKLIEVAPCPHCGKNTSTRWDSRVYEDASDQGMFEDDPLLHEYSLKDGTKVRAVIQAVPWSSGPCIFMCLEDATKNRMFEWSEHDIAEA